MNIKKISGFNIGYYFKYNFPGGLPNIRQNVVVYLNPDTNALKDFLILKFFKYALPSSKYNRENL